MHEDLTNKFLFTEHAKGHYTYGESELGKSASGNLELKKGKRNPKAQIEVGGEDRLKDDDGGHLLATRFNGSSETENMDPQNKNINRGTYKKMENRWAESLENGDKVYVHVETFKSNDSERPDVYMGYTITEHPDKSRDWEAFSVQNESATVQETRNQEVAQQNDLHREYHNAMEYSAEEQKLCNEFADLSAATGSKKQNSSRISDNKGEITMADQSKGSGQSSSASQMGSASKSSASTSQTASRGHSASQMSSASQSNTSQSANRSNSASQMKSASRNSGQGNNPYRTQGKSVSQTGYRSTSSMNRSQTSRNHSNNQKRGH